ncbi:MAG: Nif11-like leader peptide family natural product precursor [Leptolyngbya sp. SIO1E4]|nr:Nif11-like leader peptide family natural product precursor [Leptolyngbya sp. SIO1E4]
MTTTAVQDFLTKVGEDQELQGEMAKALEAENDREAVTALAQAKGYEFTSEELWAEVQARQAELEQRQAAGELTDEELEAVAGGEIVVAISIVKTLSVAFSAGAAISLGGGIAYGATKW